MITDPEKPNFYTAESWADIQDFLFEQKNSDLDRFRSDFAYRGYYNIDHPKLLTSIQRMGRQPSLFEDHLIRNFKKYAPLNTLTGQYDNIWNWISLGQHYGLPTRLLDWSFSPNVALHFMADFDKGFNNDGVIWMVNIRKIATYLPDTLKEKLQEKSYLAFTPGELNEYVGKTTEDIRSFTAKNGNCMLFVEPPSIDDRIVNQFALFSFMLDPDSDKSSWLEDKPDLYKKIKIPAALKWEIRDKLDQANISERIIYPGLDGISKWLKRWYSAKNKNWELSDLLAIP